MIIGTFTREGDNLIGSIRTLSLVCAAAFEPAEKTSDKSPDYRLIAGTFDFGAAWKETSEKGNAYLSVQLDDPSFPTPIRCVLVKASADDSFNLLWERSRKRA